MQDDRARWDARYRGQGLATALSAHWVEAVCPLPSAGTALDIACGRGALACYWAARGLTTTATDISPQALSLTERLAAQERLTLTTLALDLDADPLPAGPFAVISCAHFLDRSLWSAMVARLAAGGLLVLEIATVHKLERSARPSRRFLLDEGELAAAFRALASVEILYSEEAWRSEQHTARLVARKLP